MEAAKEEFLRQFGEDYGYARAPKNVDEIRTSEFKRLEGLVYLDHAGATLYSETQMEAVAKDFTSNVFGNPHSQSDSSVATSGMITAARQQVLEFCNASAKDYTCIFTSGATAALKLIGEAFPWSRRSYYIYTMENHNSVLGIREYALDYGASALAVDIEDINVHSELSGSYDSNIKVAKHSVQRRSAAKSSSESVEGNVYNLFAFPSECNFSGQKFNLDLVKIVKANAGRIFEGSTKCHGCWMVLVDAAKGCATEPPDLARFPADFVVLSFYKIFGYPTGLGALIIRNEAAKLLRKTYFSGGTVLASIANVDFIKRRECVDQLFEDGTLSFLSIASIRHGFKIINTLTVSAITRHTASLTSYVKSNLASLKHHNGAEVCILYGRDFAKLSFLGSGPTIVFNLKRPDGSWFGHREVEKLASLSGIQLRTGCFCNPGACAKFLGLSQSDLMSNFEAGHVCWDDFDILHGKPTGAVRISFGYMSVFDDAWNFLRFIEDSFVSKQNSIQEEYSLAMKMVPFPAVSQKHIAGVIHLKAITIYPIKSCAGFSADCWPLSHTGLKYDREWLLKEPNGEILTQKKAPEMSKIYTFVDLTRRILIIESPNCNEKLNISIEYNFNHDLMEELDVCGQRYEVEEYDDEVNKWFTIALARPCALVRCHDFKSQRCMNKGYRSACRDTKTKMNFVNEAPLLLISLDSVNDLNRRLRLKYIQDSDHRSEQPANIDPIRFRPNLVVSGSEPYAEDNWRHLHIGNAHFTSLGGCNRCQIINLDPLLGNVRKSKEPLATLASFRRHHGKIIFGILLRYDENVGTVENKDDAETWLQVGQKLYPDLM